MVGFCSVTGSRVGAGLLACVAVGALPAVGCVGVLCVERHGFAHGGGRTVCVSLGRVGSVHRAQFIADVIN